MPKSKSMKIKTVNGVTFLEGSDNIFRDLGFPEPEAASLLGRSHLMIEIKNIIDERKLTQTQAAKILGVRQPRVSAMYTGRLEDFTIDMLVQWLAKLGKQVTITVEDRDVA